MPLRQLKSMFYIVAAIMFAVVAARSSLAGTCGDYLQHKTTNHVVPASETPIPVAPKPCHGPRCSAAPIEPANVPVTTPSAPEPTRNSIALFGAGSFEAANIGVWLESPVSAYFYLSSEDIFHPPRSI